MAGEAWDVLHEPDTTGGHWSTDNVGEAAPGVLTPLSWSIWRTVGDRAPREVAFRMGAFSGRERRDFPDIIRPFYGRIAIRMVRFWRSTKEVLTCLGSGLPHRTLDITSVSLGGEYLRSASCCP